MYPLVSALKETPNSTGESAPTSVTAGTALAGQIVFVAAAFAEKPRATTRANNVTLAYALALNRIDGMNLSIQRNPHFAVLTDQNRPCVRTKSLLNGFCVGLMEPQSLGLGLG